jgi:chemotaxis protein methyltransferase WspC
MASLGKALNDSGVLFVGPGEGFLAMSCGLHSTRQNMAFAYRKKSQSSPLLAMTLQSNRYFPTRRTSGRRKRADSTQLTQRFLPVESAPIPNLATARALANNGQLKEALEICQACLSISDPTSEAFYLLGLIVDAMDDYHEAAGFYRKALYLEPNNIEVLTHLALLQERNGDFVSAAPLHERIRRLQKNPKVLEVPAGVS